MFVNYKNLVFFFQYVNTEEFAEQPFAFRLFYMVPMFQIFRSRLYLAWIMSELMCFTAGLGAYPVEAKARIGEGPHDYVALKKWWVNYFMKSCFYQVVSLCMSKLTNH